MDYNEFLSLIHDGGDMMALDNIEARLDSGEWVVSSPYETVRVSSKREAMREMADMADVLVNGWEVSGDEAALQRQAETELRGVITVQEAAEAFSIHRQTVHDAIERGYIPARQSGSTWLLRRQDARDRWGSKAIFYECIAEGHAPHYATREEAERSIEALHESDESYADIEIGDIYHEVRAGEVTREGAAWEATSPSTRALINLMAFPT